MEKRGFLVVLGFDGGAGAFQEQETDHPMMPFLCNIRSGLNFSSPHRFGSAPASMSAAFSAPRAAATLSAERTRWTAFRCTISEHNIHVRLRARDEKSAYYVLVLEERKQQLREGFTRYTLASLHCRQHQGPSSISLVKRSRFQVTYPRRRHVRAALEATLSNESGLHFVLRV